MERRRAILRTGLTMAAVGIAGCSQVEDFVGNTTVPESNGFTDEPSQEREPNPEPTATATSALPRGLTVVSATGTNIDGKYVGTVRVVVEKAPGTEQVDLSTVRATWLDPGGEYRVAANSVDSNTAHGHFGIQPVDGPAYNNDTVIETADERYELVFDLGRDQSTVDDPQDGVSGPGAFGRRVEAGWVISLELTTGTGRTSETKLQVPDAVGGRESVTLR